MYMRIYICMYVRMYACRYMYMYVQRGFFLPLKFDLTLTCHDLSSTV